MCGIAGYFYFSRKRSTCAQLVDMSSQIAHRGPDDEGFVFIDTLKSGSPFHSYDSVISAQELKKKSLLPI
jgi:asparagine synthetase B (glutamine-hydrolysing)